MARSFTINEQDDAVSQKPRPDQSPSPAARRAFEHGSSGATADFAVEGWPDLSERSTDTPHARPAAPLPSGAVPDQLAEKVQAVGGREEARIDESVEESFPASDPPSFQPRKSSEPYGR